MLHQCFTCVSPEFHQCFTSVSPVFHQCYISVIPVFHQCFTSVSPMLKVSKKNSSQLLEHKEGLFFYLNFFCDHISLPKFKSIFWFWFWFVKSIMWVKNKPTPPRSIYKNTSNPLNTVGKLRLFTIYLSGNNAKSLSS